MIALLCCALARAASPAPPDVASVLATFADEPDIRLVQRWASEHSHSEPERMERRIRDSRRAAALPTLWVGYKVTHDWDQDLRYVATDGLTDQHDDTLVGLPEDEAFGRQAQMSLQARWDLDELLASSDQARMLSEAGDTARRRQQVLSETTRIYFERRRLQVAGLLEPAFDTPTRTQRALRIAELTAHLDALTDGRFSAALEESR